MKNFLRCAGVMAGLCASGVCAEAAILYDSELMNLPANQGWTYLADPSAGSATQANASGFGVVLNSPTASDKAGYFSRFPFLGTHPGVGVLNRTTGFTLNLRVRLLSEAHANNDRAGFSVIVLTSDLKGIELGFWADEIWAQADAPMFTHAEGVKMTVAGRVLRLGLQILGDNYTLSEGNTVLLTGALRNYSSFGAPYNFSNFIFLGDDTTSASGRVEISRMLLNGATMSAPFVDATRNTDATVSVSYSLGEPGTYLLQRSTDFKTWETFETLTRLSGRVTKAAPGDGDFLFYRAVMTDPPLP